jgi:hypothetical protein
LDVTEGRVVQLAQRDLLRRAKEGKKELRGRYDLRENVVAYIRHLRLREGRNGDGDDFSRARSRRMTALASIEEARAREMSGEVLRRDHVISVVTNLLSVVRSHMMAVPSRLMHRLLGLTDKLESYRIVNDEIRRSLTELSNFDPSEFDERNAKRLERRAANGEKLDAIDD